jgi:predicted transcriptional regulator
MSTKRPKSTPAAEALAAHAQVEDWQLGEIAAGLAELDSGKLVEHEKVAKWLRT